MCVYLLNYLLDGYIGGRVASRVVKWAGKRESGDKCWGILWGVKIIGILKCQEC